MAPSSAADLWGHLNFQLLLLRFHKMGVRAQEGKSTSGATEMFWAANEVLLLHPGNAVSLARCPDPARGGGISKKAAWLWFEGQLWALFRKWTPPPTTKHFCFPGRIKKKICSSSGDPCPRGTIPPEGHGLNISSRIPPSILYCTEMSCSGLVFNFLLPSQCWTQKTQVWDVKATESIV